MSSVLVQPAENQGSGLKTFRNYSLPVPCSNEKAESSDYEDGYRYTVEQ